jgi:CheY-like chemotaxis protein
MRPVNWRPEATSPTRRQWPTAVFARRQAASGQLRRQPGARVLVVDDDPGVRTLIADLLSGAGYQVDLASNGREALLCVERQRPALVLLDLVMPVLDGPQFVRELGVRGLHLPVLVVSADQNGAAVATECRAAGFLAKPFDRRELLTLVRQMTTPRE